MITKENKLLKESVKNFIHNSEMVLCKNDSDLRNSKATPLVKAFLRKKNVNELYDATVKNYSLLDQLKYNLNGEQKESFERIIKNVQLSNQHSLVNNNNDTDSGIKNFQVPKDLSLNMKKSNSGSNLPSGKVLYPILQHNSGSVTSKNPSRKISFDIDQNLKHNIPSKNILIMNDKGDDLLTNAMNNEWNEKSDRIFLKDLENRYLEPRQLRKSMRLIMHNQQKALANVKNYIT